MIVLKVTENTGDKGRLVEKLREDLNESIAYSVIKKFVRESVARKAVLEVIMSKEQFEEKGVDALIEEKMSFIEKVDSRGGFAS